MKINKFYLATFFCLITHFAFASHIPVYSLTADYVTQEEIRWFDGDRQNTQYTYQNRKYTDNPFFEFYSYQSKRGFFSLSEHDLNVPYIIFKSISYRHGFIDFPVEILNQFFRYYDIGDLGCYPIPYWPGQHSHGPNDPTEEPLPSEVPEPASIMLFIVGIGIILSVRLRQSKNQL
ncbi:PEP-CTERM sorting domain-containing protein [Vibrio salinus]|uniref:PEP-CTERM sorting domain-containing protein n=1 Tax=Vibrio salinus TaxID=2899784 RepID=UPI001E58CC9F|nr:PEP-CTERM sorting domain-containing protein [Vibrio salinus]MCE0492429.1 PEP-CTERM sorting domain-containing protein [Vibrio salinus]